MSDNTIQTEILVHDLKVPVSVIDAGAKSLLNRQDVYGPLTEKQVKVVKRIIRNTLTTQRLVNDVLELGRSREGVIIKSDFPVFELVRSVLIENFDLSEPDFVEKIRKTQRFSELVQILETKCVRLSFDKKTWMTIVHLDYAKVKQILRNLVTNAFKHKLSLVEIEGKIIEDQLILKIRDDGKGIPPEDHKKIFETYFTTGAPIGNAIESHGLGLAGVMVFLKDMGGNLVLESGHGEGAEFIVTIPL